MDDYEGPVELAEILESFKDPKVREQMRHQENNYRRGYTHGYNQALDDLLSLLNRGKDGREAERLLSSFFNDHLMEGWRNRFDTMGDPPPALPLAS